MSLPTSLKNFNCFVDGESYLGKIPEMTIPDLARKMEEYRAGGMNLPIDADQGMEKMECEITLAEWNTALLKKFGVTSVDGVSLRFMGAAVSDDTTSVTDAIEIVMRGRFRNVNMATAKPGEGSPMKLMASIAYYKYIVNDEEIIEIDALNMVETVGGVDRLEAQRAALGA